MAFADNHGKSNDSKDVEEVTNAVLKMYEMANNKKHWTPMISDKGSYQFWSSGGFLKHVKKDAKFNEIENNNNKKLVIIDKVAAWLILNLVKAVS